MATEQDITEFHKGEYVEFTVAAKNPDGTVVSSPASQVMYMTIAASDDASALVQVSTTSGEITLTDAGNGIFTVALTPADLTDIKEGRTYHYNVWTELASKPVVQAKGAFTLQDSIAPA